MPTLTLEALQRKHKEWQECHEYWALLRKMVSGGRRLDKSARRELLVNPDGRSESVIRERIQLSRYTNRISVPIKRITSQLFQKDAKYLANGGIDETWQEFINNGAWLRNDDDASASLLQLLRRACHDLLTVGKAIALIDTKAQDSGQLNLIEQRNQGVLNPSVMLIPRENLWDWDVGASGFNYAKIYRAFQRKANWKTAPVTVHDFTIYERQDSGVITVSRYWVTPKPEKNKEDFNIHNAKEDDVIISAYQAAGGYLLEDRPIFSYRGKYLFPLVSVSVEDEFWVADQLFDSGKAQFNAETGIAYALTKSLFQMPAFIRGDEPTRSIDGREENILGDQKLGDGFFLVLPKGTQIATISNGGESINVAMNYVESLSANIYEVLQQISISAQNSVPSVIARSGISKKEDRRPESLLMELFGEQFRGFATGILNVAAIVRAEDVKWTVEGFDDFLSDGLLEYLAGVNQVAALHVPSETFQREVYRAIATKVAQALDLSEQVLEKSKAEIEGATKQELESAIAAVSGQPPPLATEQAPAPQTETAKGNQK